jgi:prevent-host-death family protein
MIVNMHQAKTQLSKLVELARRGEDVVIAKDGEPVARLISAGAKRGDRPIGLHKGLFRLKKNFNDPLPEGFDGLS